MSPVLVRDPYVVVILDDAGNMLAEVEAQSDHDYLVGHELVISGENHIIERVRHEELDTTTWRKQTAARIFVRRLPRDRPAAPSDDQADGGGPGRVIPLAPRTRGLGPGVRSELLPAELVAVLVACGYRAQATELKARGRLAAKLIREGQRWYVAPEAGPEEMRRLSRLAKRCYGEMLGLIRELAAGGVPEAISAAHAHASPSPAPQAAPPGTASSPPALKLVRRA